MRSKKRSGSGGVALPVQAHDQFGFALAEFEFLHQTVRAGPLLYETDRVTVGLLVTLLDLVGLLALGKDLFASRQLAMTSSAAKSCGSTSQ